MLSFDRRVTLEDHLGVRHPACLLETIEGHYFVLVSPRDARLLGSLQADGALDETALDILERAVGLMDVRRHEFLGPDLAAEVLARSKHPILRWLAAHLGGAVQADVAVPREDLSAHAFLEECRRRSAL